MKERILNRFLIVIILAIVVSKFIHIEADPWSIKSTADIHDEAWWAENAKLKIQEDKWIKDDIAGGLALSPIINLVYYCSFKLFGISFFSLRIFSVLASILNILLYYLLSKRYLLSIKEALLSTLLFASLPIYFIIGRTGLLETGLISILLISILLVLQNNYWLVFFAGVSAALGLQMKGSFIFLMPIIIYLLHAKNNNTIKKDLSLFCLGVILVSLSFYLFYYYPNLSLFQAYYNAFSNEFYTLKELLNPAGIVIRLGYLFSKETLSDPFIFSMILLLIYRIVYFKSNNEMNKLMLGFFIGFVCTLFSDFNDKRILIICIGIPIFLSKSISDKGKMNLNMLRNVSIFCSFSLFSFMPNIHLINWKEPYLVGISLDSVLLFSIALVLIFTIFIQLESREKYKNLVEFVYGLLIIFFLSKILAIIISNQLNLDIESLYLMTITAIIVFSIYYFLISRRMSFNYLIPIIICIQISYISFQLYSDTFEIRKLNLAFAKMGKSGERTIGPNSIFEISFLSSTHPIYFSNRGKIGKEISMNDVKWYGAITNSEYSEENLYTDLMLTERNLKMHFEPYYSQKTYKIKYKALIFRRVD
jgi:4-amino-4-deoxy-L-arabinose transferase-like glycosyltransferase